MRATIKLRQHGTLSFWCPDTPRGGYVRLERPGRPGTLGQQICQGGQLFGNTVSATPDTLARTVRTWWRHARPTWEETV